MGLFLRGRNLEKAKVGEVPSNIVKPASFAFDPRIISNNFGKDVPDGRHPGAGGLPYDACLAMTRIPVIGAIVGTRTNQCAEFARPQPDPYSVGFRVKHRYDKRKPNNRNQKRIDDITEIINRAGGPYWRGGFDAFIRTIVPDSLTYDQVNFEPILDKSGKPWGFIPVDPQTIRWAKPSQKELQAGRRNPEDAGFVQIVDDKVVREFDEHEMAFCIRRPRSDYRMNGYGWPEPEQLINTITSLVNAETFNAAKFNNGIAPRMILGIKSSMDGEMFQAMERQVWAMLNGVAQHGRVPIVQLDPEAKEAIEAVHLNAEAAEMEYREWVNWLLKVVCGVYLIDPAEIGFVFGNEGQGSGLQNSSAADRVIMSREKGLRPLLRDIAYWLNEYIIYPYDDDYELEFVGIDSDTEEQRNKLDEQAVQYFNTVDEIRERRGEDPLPDGMGKILLNGTWIQHKQYLDEKQREEEMALQEFNAFMGEGQLPDSDILAGQDMEAMNPAAPGGEQLQASALSKASKDVRVKALEQLDEKSVKEYAKALGWAKKKIEVAAK